MLIFIHSIFDSFHLFEYFCLSDCIVFFLTEEILLAFLVKQVFESTLFD